jgi:hypothetical protein
MTQEAKNDYVFPVDAFPSTLTDEHKRDVLRDQPRVLFLKFNLPILVEKISSKDPKASLESLAAELKALLKIFIEIFESDKLEELNVLRLSIRQLGFSGKARILTIISNCKELDDEKRNAMKKIVLDETRPERV